ncbi:winged helix-turn-helix domain-containing protein [Desulfomicrobium escambiense]|uniref:winged helix-turn-helix domain-containing protein n=1 Tax=Desulfomicrobium escambiense TaxID=29503 RepID=UPI000420889C|nr:LysR family transcriptional regulator [Desulfomicrobium escambiense]
MTDSAVGETLTMRLHLWFERDEKIFLGIGRALLLEKIEEYGSLRQAATEMKMSYRAAWGKLKAAEESIGKPLVQKVKGKGQRYELTPVGRQLARQFMQLQQDVEAFAKTKAQELFGDNVQYYADAYPEHKLSSLKPE